MFTHAVGNPPYIRWSKIPPGLRARYDRRLSPDVTGGDLFLPFLDLSFALLQTKGRCGFLCSNRWRFMAFAERFRAKWLPHLKITLEESVRANDVFEASVASYPNVLIASKEPKRTVRKRRLRRSPRKTLIELGCSIKVGPALGPTSAFVLQPGEHDVESELLNPWVDGSEITEGAIQWHGRRVIVMHDDTGRLVDLDRFPLLRAGLSEHRRALGQRSIVRRGAPWFRPIDRVRAVDWQRSKLLLPELARNPRVAIDRSGAIPSHGVYAICPPQDDVESLYARLGDGKLGRLLAEVAPQVKGGYLRCYRRFLSLVRV